MPNRVNVAEVRAAFQLVERRQGRRKEGISNGLFRGGMGARTRERRVAWRR
jgi:hypothetical protein